MDGVSDARSAAMMLEKMTALAPHAKTPEMKRLVKQAQLLRAFGERHEEIERARKTLEEHRTEFETLMEDERAYLERARAVFSEDRFSMARSRMAARNDFMARSSSMLEAE